jgi:hypothetical protein
MTEKVIPLAIPPVWDPATSDKQVVMCLHIGQGFSTYIDRAGATVGALRDQARDVDTTIRTKQGWRPLYEARAS